jgi:hypothetical protein
VPGSAVGRCDKCGGEQPTWELIKCHICGHTTCYKCATFAYGRYFCSNHCAQYFFHAEPDDDEKPDET